MTAMAGAVEPIKPALGAGSDLFPESPRVVYSRAPLVQVVAQLRFPPILRIQSDAPADFQDRIRNTFPLLERGAVQTPPVSVGQPIPPEILQILSMGVLDNSYRFVTEDRKTTIILVAESISLSTTDYKDWSEFKKMFGVAFDALMAIYKPSYFTRVGLRYTNAIDRSMLELASTPWSQLLRPEIIGELALPQFENSLEAVKHMLRLKTNEGSVTLQHGTAIVQGHSEQCYTLDCDFSSSQKTVADDVQPLLAQFNDRAFRAFRWCITDTLHRALGPMDPNPVSGV